jgi:hypothetical protein
LNQQVARQKDFNLEKHEKEKRTQKRLIEKANAAFNAMDANTKTSVRKQEMGLKMMEETEILDRDQK